MKQKNERWTVYSLRLAQKLVRRGFEIIGTAPDKVNPYYNVYYFRYSKELMDAIEELK